MIKPIRNDDTKISNSLMYDVTSGEIVYNNDVSSKIQNIIATPEETNFSGRINGINIRTNGSEFNTLIGSETYTTTGVSNTAIGRGALISAEGAQNIAIGVNSQRNSVGGLDNISIGNLSLLLGNSLQNNIAIGHLSQLSSLDTTSNVSVGNNTLHNTVNGSTNVAVGTVSMYQNIAGSNNVALGHSSLLNCISDNNTAIGYNSGIGIITQTNTISIGNLADATESNQCVIGNSELTEVKTSGVFNGSGFKIGTTGTTHQYLTADGLFRDYTSSVAIGNEAGLINQGINSIAIGNQAGQANQFPNSIVLNATGVALSSSTTGFFVKPVMENPVSSSNHIATYNPTSGEISYDTTASNIFSGGTNIFVSQAIVGDTPTFITNKVTISNTNPNTKYLISVNIVGLSESKDETIISTLGRTNGDGVIIPVAINNTLNLANNSLFSTTEISLFNPSYFSGASANNNEPFSNVITFVDTLLLSGDFTYSVRVLSSDPCTISKNVMNVIKLG